MHETASIIQNLTLILLMAGLMSTLFGWIRLPGILAFILTGVIIGPGGLKLVDNTSFINSLAQMGIIFLLFVLGAELSLPRLKEFRIHTFWAGALQMVLTIMFFSVCLLGFGVGIKQSIFLAGALALSSTAIVIKTLADRMEMESVHGRMITGILIVQDLSLVPLIAFMPLLTSDVEAASLVPTFGMFLLKSVLFLGITILLSLKFLPRMIDFVAAKSGKDTFGVFVMAFSLLLAFIAESVGLSYAIGAFIAGLSLSQSISSRQIIANFIPFRDIFSAVFFVTVGMLTNVPFMLKYPGLILAITAAIILIKFLSVFAAIKLIRFPFKTSLWGGLALFQVGEFSFILLETGIKTGTIDEFILNAVGASVILTMLLTPLFISQVPAIIQFLQTKGPFARQMKEPEEAGVQNKSRKDDVIIAGYGPVAQNLIRVLQTHHIPFRVIEMNINTVKKLQEKGIQCEFGDASSLEVLEHSNLRDAKVFAVTIPDVHAAELAIQHAKELNPDIYCIVRSRFRHHLEGLFQLGASEVVYEEFETSMSFIHSILDIYGEYVTDKESYMLLLRQNRNTLSKLNNPEEGEHAYARFSLFKDTKIEWLTVTESSPLLGQTLAQAELRQKTGVNVISMILADGTEELSPSPDIQIAPHQILIAIGTLDQLNSLEILLG